MLSFVYMFNQVAFVFDIRTTVTMKENLKKLIEKIQSHIYLYDWLKPIVCRFFGHDVMARYMVYQQEKIIKNHDKTHIKLIKHRYDPYFVYSCKRCGKKLGTKKLARQLTREQAEKFSREKLQQIKAYKEYRKDMAK